MTIRPTPRWLRPTAIAAALFGGLTILSGGSVLFGPEAAQRAAGDAVPFVVMFNTAAGFAYLVGAWALWQNHRAATWIALAIGGATLAVLAAFAVVFLTGTPVELRTAVALPFRAAVWLVIAWATHRESRLT